MTTQQRKAGIFIFVLLGILVCQALSSSDAETQTTPLAANIQAVYLCDGMQYQHDWETGNTPPIYFLVNAFATTKHGSNTTIADKTTHCTPLHYYAKHAILFLSTYLHHVSEFQRLHNIVLPRTPAFGAFVLGHDITDAAMFLASWRLPVTALEFDLSSYWALQGSLAISNQNLFHSPFSNNEIQAMQERVHWAGKNSKFCHWWACPPFSKSFKSGVLVANLAPEEISAVLLDQNNQTCSGALDQLDALVLVLNVFYSSTFDEAAPVLIRALNEFRSRGWKVKHWSTIHSNSNAVFLLSKHDALHYEKNMHTLLHSNFWHTYNKTAELNDEKDWNQRFLQNDLHPWQLQQYQLYEMTRLAPHDSRAGIVSCRYSQNKQVFRVYEDAALSPFVIIRHLQKAALPELMTTKPPRNARPHIQCPLLPTRYIAQEYLTTRSNAQLDRIGARHGWFDMYKDISQEVCNSAARAQQNGTFWTFAKRIVNQAVLEIDANKLEHSVFITRDGSVLLVPQKNSTRPPSLLMHRPFHETSNIQLCEELFCQPNFSLALLGQQPLRQVARAIIVLEKYSSSFYHDVLEVIPRLLTVYDFFLVTASQDTVFGHDQFVLIGLDPAIQTLAIRLFGWPESVFFQPKKLLQFQKAEDGFFIQVTERLFWPVETAGQEHVKDYRNLPTQESIQRVRNVVLQNALNRTYDSSAQLDFPFVEERLCRSGNDDGKQTRGIVFADRHARNAANMEDALDVIRAFAQSIQMPFSSADLNRKRETQTFDLASQSQFFFCNAGILIGEHGANLVHLIALHPTAVVVELFPQILGMNKARPPVYPNYMYLSLALGLEYFYVVADSETNTYPLDVLNETLQQASAAFQKRREAFRV